MDKDLEKRVSKALNARDYELLVKEISEAPGGALADCSHGFSQLFFECLVHGRVKEAKVLLGAGCTGKTLEDTNGSPLVGRLAEIGQVESVKLLLNAGADPNARNSFGNTPLMSAAFSMRLEMVEFLLSAGADSSLRDANGMTAGDMARHRASNEASDSLWALMGNSIANVLVKSEVGKTMLEEPVESAPRKTSKKI